MQSQEIKYWLDQIFPAPLNHEVRGGVHIGVGTLPDGDEVAATSTFSGLDFFLSAPAEAVGAPVEGDAAGQAQVAVRSELFAVAHPVAEGAKVPPLAELVLNTARMLALSAGALVPQPGTIVPDIGGGMGALLIAPFVWADGVPRLVELEPAPMVTLMLQVVPLTAAEVEYALTYGPADLQQQMASQGIDILDLSRS